VLRLTRPCKDAPHPRRQQQPSRSYAASGCGCRSCWELLAIWEAMSSPLRCLDEFDVFMDNVNRAISTNMLVSCLGHVRGVVADIAQITAGRRSVNRGIAFPSCGS
jgi:hypothetical protein